MNSHDLTGTVLEKDWATTLTSVSIDEIPCPVLGQIDGTRMLDQFIFFEATDNYTLIVQAEKLRILLSGHSTL